jgi:hypothetical protein
MSDSPRRSPSGMRLTRAAILVVTLVTGVSGCEA